MPWDNAFGFAPADWLLLLLSGVLLLAGFLWRPRIQEVMSALAGRTRLCMVLLFLLPICMRLALLAHHPVPTPAIYDEFSHLLVADTLLHGRLANPQHPLHEFFETFFVLQTPTYSSIYSLGSGLVLAFGRVLTGNAWTGVLLASGALCSGCYWMLRGWVTPGWAFLGGIFAVITYGPLCAWTNSYWGGPLAALGGCLVFGAIPRIRNYGRVRDAMILGVGFGVHMLARQFESALLFLVIAVFVVSELVTREKRTRIYLLALVALAGTVPAVALTLLQGRSVTGKWFMLPEQMSQYEYGVPTSLTIQPLPQPHVTLTPQQELDYKAQSLTHGSAADSITKFLLRLEYRVRYYRFFFAPPLYLAAAAFLFSLRQRRSLFIAFALSVFALGTNLFPYLLPHYLAAVACLFVLASLIGLQQIARVRIGSAAIGMEIVQLIVAVTVAEFLFWYSLHLFERPSFYDVLKYETWDSINHDASDRRTELSRKLGEISGQLLVFVHYTPRHIFQNEWVWNGADIDHSRVVFARDLGAEKNVQLIRYYPNRKPMLMQPDEDPPRIEMYRTP